MQLRARSEPQDVLEPLIERLRSMFGDVPVWRRRDPLGQLLWCLLSVGTAQHVAQSVYGQLKARFHPWSKLAEARADEIAPFLASLPSPSAKTQALMDVLRAVTRRIGSLRLDWLGMAPAGDALAWLEELPGVDVEIAASVLNLSTLQRAVMVVDGAAERTLKRLGVVQTDVTPRGCGEAVGELAPSSWAAQDYADLHVLLQRLGETVCRPGQPDCGACGLRPLCRQGSAQQKPGRASHANENHAPGDRLDDYLRRRVARLEQDGVSSRTLVDSGVSWGCPEIDTVFVGGKLPAGVHQSCGDRMEDGAGSLFPALATAVRLPKAGSVRLLVIQEADARREYGELHGPGLEAFGLHLDEVAFVRVKQGVDALACADEALRQHACSTILLELRRSEAAADLSVTRRFNLAARRSGAFLFLVTPNLGGASAAVTRWKVAAKPSEAPRKRIGPPVMGLELVRNRSGQLGRWDLTWSAERRAASVAPRGSIRAAYEALRTGTLR